MTLPSSDWINLLGHLAGQGVAPATMLFEHPKAVDGAVTVQSGDERPVLPIEVQAAVLKLVKAHPRGSMPDIYCTANELLTRAATYAGLTGELAARMRRSKHDALIRAIMSNPTAPPSMLRRFTKVDTTRDKQAWFNPSASQKMRIEILSRSWLGYPNTSWAHKGLAALSAKDFAALTTLVTEAGARFEAAGDDAERTDRTLACNASVLAVEACRRGDQDLYRALLCLSLRSVRTSSAPSVDLVICDQTPMVLVEALTKLGPSTPMGMCEVVDSVDWSSDLKNVADTVASWAPGDPRLMAAVLSDVDAIRDVALARNEIGEGAVIDWICETLVESPVSTDALAAVVARFGTKRRIELLERLLTDVEAVADGDAGPVGATQSRRLDAASVAVKTDAGNVDMDLAKRYVAAVSTSARRYSRNGPVVRLLDALGPDLYGELTPSYLVAVAPSPKLLANWLTSELDAEGVEMFMTLGPTWESSSRDLLETVKAMTVPAAS